jgi:hypothetical protein
VQAATRGVRASMSAAGARIRLSFIYSFSFEPREQTGRD